MFDSHVAIRLEHAVSLVNALTDGAARGRDYTAPRGAELPAAVDAAMPHTGSAGLPRTIDAAQAERLAGTARRMREVFRAVQEGELDTAAEAVNQLLRDTAARPRLDRAEGVDGGGVWHLHFHGANDSFASGVGASCATALALVVGGGLAGRLGVCQADRCDRVYADTSRNAARQFCSTACQNRTKAAAFRARKNADG
ncbi:CGNR zinc finger domain-containing protein [Streptomyces sp. NPDC048442]|uniref:CGNR zinc finger domain-containing protein n=1 Tax=Streptomyces sp. NPDC048442 TaxID=3154823 RepID=UPI00343BCC35